MDVRERFTGWDEALAAALQGVRYSIWTALPCTVHSIDFEKQTGVFQPTVKGAYLLEDGTVKATDLPLLHDVPLHFPSGGGVTMTMPVKAGDEALVVFSSRPIDLWHQSGGTQGQVDSRTHSLSDGFAFVGFRSNPRAISDVSSESTQIRSDDGKHVVDIHPQTGLTLSSEGSSIAIGKDGIAINSPTLTHNGVNISSTHVHGGVEKGGSTTSVPE
jgi:hypothetical protein